VFTSDQVRLLVNFVPRCECFASCSVVGMNAARDHYRYHVLDVYKIVLSSLPSPPSLGVVGGLRVWKSEWL